MSLTKYQREALALVRERLDFGEAAFGFSDDQLAKIQARERYLANDAEEVREVTRIYRETWILPLLDELLAGGNPIDSYNGGEAAGALNRWEQEFGGE